MDAYRSPLFSRLISQAIDILSILSVLVTIITLYQTGSTF